MIKLFALLSLSYICIVSMNVMWGFLALPWVGLQCVIVVFPDHTNLLFYGLLQCDFLILSSYGYVGFMSKQCAS